VGRESVTRKGSQIVKAGIRRRMFVIVMRNEVAELEKWMIYGEQVNPSSERDAVPGEC
jgi:hypothetical protein